MNLFTINFKKGEKIYIQIYEYIKAQIINGNLKTNEILPSKRKFANHLGVSINSICTAYNLLLDEGYIKSIEKKGYYISFSSIELNTLPFKEPTIDKKEIIKYDFTTSSIDVNNFPSFTWARLTKDIIYHQNIIEKTDSLGSPDLRASISKHLFESRGINIDYKNIIIGSGTEYLITLLLPLLNISSMAIENPGYDKMYKILKNNDINTLAIPLDDEGLRIDKLIESHAEACYITPANQFPTGIRMSLKRKKEIALWGNSNYIIEDDYDSEFRILGKPEIPLYALNPSKTILISTFSKTVCPSLRISYMVLPDELISLYIAKYGFYSTTVSTLDQITLHEFIKKGLYQRHINKIKNLNKQKREMIISILSQQPYLTINTKDSYLSIIITINQEFDKNKFLESIENTKIKINFMSDFYFLKTNDKRLIVGYSGIDIENIKDGLEILLRCLKASFLFFQKN